MNALQTAVIGRPSIISEELITKLIKHLSVGNYIKPSCEAAGLSYAAFRKWMIQGETDAAAGRDTPFSKLVDRVARAQAEAETSLAGRLHGSDDWRAQSFLLERGPGRQRWGKMEEQRAPTVIVQIPDSLASVMADALRVGSKHVIEGEVIEADQIEQDQSADKSST